MRLPSAPYMAIHNSRDQALLVTLHPRLHKAPRLSFTAEVGDYDLEDHPPGYVAQFKMLPKQTAKQEEKIAEIHKSMASNGG